MFPRWRSHRNTQEVLNPDTGGYVSQAEGRWFWITAGQVYREIQYLKKGTKGKIIHTLNKIWARKTTKILALIEDFWL